VFLGHVYTPLYWRSAECIKAEPRYEFVDGPGILPMIQDKKSNSKPETVPVNNAPKDNNETKSDRPADEVRGVEGDASNVVAADDVINARNNETKDDGVDADDVAVVQESPQAEVKSEQVCPHTTIHVSCYYNICVLILLYMSPHTTICVLILLYVSSYRRWSRRHATNQRCMSSNDRENSNHSIIRSWAVKIEINCYAMKA
jgi:hypothetical protein